MITLSSLSAPTGGGNNDAVQQEVGNLNQTLTDGLAVIEEFLQSQLDIATLSNELSQEFSAWDMPAQFEDLKAILDLAALSTLEGMTAVLGETFAVQNELMNANTETTLLTIAELLNMHMAALLLTETMLGVNNMALLMENNLYLAAIVEAIALADINNVATIIAVGQQITANNSAWFSSVQTAMENGFTYTGMMQNLSLSQMNMWFAALHTEIANGFAVTWSVQTVLTSLLAAIITLSTQMLISTQLTVLAAQMMKLAEMMTSLSLIITALGLINTNILRLGSKMDNMLIRFDDIAGNARGIYGNLLLTNLYLKYANEYLSDPEPVELARRANDLAEEGNALAREANTIAKWSLGISTVTSIVSILTSLLFPTGIVDLGAKLVKRHASGGYPTTGQMFIAREAGPELVGTIGGRSAVVNNNQIVEAVSNGVARAVAGVLGTGRSGQNVQVFIGNEQLDSYIVRSQRRQALRTNGKMS